MNLTSFDVFSKVNINYDLFVLVHVLERNVTTNTRGGFTRNSAPFWARGQDAFLVIRRSRDRAHLVELETDFFAGARAGENEQVPDCFCVTKEF